MKKSIEKIGIIAVMGIMLIGAYLLGTTQAKTITETKTVIKQKPLQKKLFQMNILPLKIVYHLRI